MIEVKDLTGADLALWAARAAKLDNPRIAFDICRIGPFSDLARDFCPHEDWADCGPLIFEHNIAIAKGANQICFPGWHAKVGLVNAYDTIIGRQFGPDPLVAAMRALVWYVYGYTVPDEVVP
jgi:hypothetical protein